LARAFEPAHPSPEEATVRSRTAVLLLLAMFVLSACANTVEGMQEDTNQNIDEAQEEVLQDDGE
jgi:predicted small secreted protein